MYKQVEWKSGKNSHSRMQNQSAVFPYFTIISTRDVLQ